jgi:peroxiredoxin
VVAISPEPPATSRALAEELKLTFPLLSDPAGQIIDAYGVRNGFSTSRTLLPHPAIVILDDELVVRFKSIDRNFKKRTTMRSIAIALDEINGAPSAPL